jgi:hypothetical protein
MTDGPSLKIERATKYINQRDAPLCEERPFSYVLEGNANTGHRATYAKKNEAVVQQASLFLRRRGP